MLEPDVEAALPRLADAYDEPHGDEAALPLFLICEAARRDVTVALTGDGGDESFAGYERYAAHRLAARRAAGRRGAAAAQALRAGLDRAALDGDARRAVARDGRGAGRPSATGG